MKKNMFFKIQNDIFELCIDKDVGGVCGLIYKPDREMQWIKSGYYFNIPRNFRKDRFGHKEFQLVDSCCDNNSYSATFEIPDLTIKSTYFFNEKGNIVIRNEICNNKKAEFFLLKGQIGFNICFYDDYCDAETCAAKRCHTHIWCGGDESWICLLRMGVSKNNLGLRCVKGGWTSYEQLDCKSNDRGYFVVHPDFYSLLPGERYVVEYELFVHEGKEDFINYLKTAEDDVYLDIKKNTFYNNEKVGILSNKKIERLVDNGSDVSYSVSVADGGYNYEFFAAKEGEHKLEIFFENKKRAYAFINVILPFEQLLEKRVEFIVEKQQYHKENSLLDGAFLIYDGEENRRYFDNIDPDLNASRERMSMGFLLAKYLQKHTNVRYYEAFKKYIEFILRECFDETTGEVFNTIGRFSEFKRLYNGAGMSRLFLETYYVFKDKKFLRYMLKIMEFYYENGGEHFYPNGICMYKMLEGLKDADMIEEEDELKKKFLVHVENIIRRGINYPKHEVNFEQTIVSPAVSFILDAYRFTGDKRYLNELKQHFDVLERFDGFQPHYKLNNIAIRFWDDYWFGKSALFGDTLPHQCTALSLNLYATYGSLSGNGKYLEKGISGLKNCLCLFFPDGKASCASVYPFRVNGQKGDFYDAWMNDQDSIMYFACEHLLN